MTTARSNKPVTADDILNEVGVHAAIDGSVGAQGDAPVEWDGEPTPLSARWMRPAFPVDALPGWVADQVVGVAEATQTPVDLAGCVALAALSTAAGGRVVVQARPGWVEPVNLYTVVAMPPGSRKSAVFAAMTRPLLEVERQLASAARIDIANAELAVRVAKARTEQAARVAEKAATEEARTTALAEASEAAAAEAELTVPPLPRLVADDVTPEAAASLLAEQQGRLAVLSAEGGIFGTLAGRYSGGAANLEVFLKGHAGDLLRIDRKGRPSEHVEHPALTLGLAVQPEVLRDIARMPGFRGRGLLARILYALPTSTVGRRKIAPPPVPDAVTTTYEANLRLLVETFADNLGEGTYAGTPVTRELDADAEELLRQFEAELEPQLGERGALGHIADWASKLAGATVRIAGLIHLADCVGTSWKRVVGVGAMDAGIRISRYYLAHALAVFDNVMGADPTVEDARMFLDWIARNVDGGKFTRRDLFTSIHGSRFPKVTDLQPGLDLLEQHGYLRREDHAPGDRGGRPSIGYLVHPSIQPAKPAEPAELPDQG